MGLHSFFRPSVTLCMLGVFNIFDLCFTLYALSLGYTEANPFLQNPFFMTVYKLTAVPLLAWCLYRLNSRRVLAVLALVYGFVNLWHIYGLFVR